MKQQQTKRWLCVRWRWWKRRRRRRWRLRERSTVNIHHHCCVSSVLVLEFYMSIYILWSIHENNNVVYSTIFDIGLHFIKIQVLHQKQQTNEIHLLLEKRELNEHLSPSSWSTSNNLIISVLNLYDKSCLNIVYISSAFAIGNLLLCPKVHSFVRLLTTHTTAPTRRHLFCYHQPTCGLCVPQILGTV